MGILQTITRNPVIISRYMSLGAAFLSTIILIKAYGISDFGLYAFYSTVFKIIGTFGSFGAGMTVTRAFGVNISKSRLLDAGVVRQYGIVIIFLSVISSAIGAYITSIFTLIPVLFFVLGGVVASWQEFAMNLVRCKQQLNAYFLLGAPIQSVGATVIILISTYYFGNSFSEAVIAAIITANVISFALFVFMLRKELRSCIVYRKKQELEFLSIAQTNITAYVSALIAVLAGSLEVIAAKAFFNDELAGIARISFQLFFLITISLALINLRHHNLINYIVNKHLLLSRKLYRALQWRYFKHSLIGILPFVVYLMLIANDIGLDDLVVMGIIIFIAYIAEVVIGPSNIFAHLKQCSHYLMFGQIFSIVIRIVILYGAHIGAWSPTNAVIIAVALSGILQKVVTRRVAL